MRKKLKRFFCILTLVSLTSCGGGSDNSSSEENKCTVEISLQDKYSVSENNSLYLYPKEVTTNSYCGEIQYEWSQLSGIQATLTKLANGFGLKIIFPSVEKNEIAHFQFSVKTDKGVFSKDTQITIVNNEGSGGSGGSGGSDSAECIRYKSNELTKDDIDLSKPRNRSINDALEIADSKNAYQLFLRNNDDFMVWIDRFDTSLSVATHEANHGIDTKLFSCLPKDKEKYFSLGKIYVTDLSGKTENYSIVEETIPNNLKSIDAFSRYQIYIQNSKKYTGNKFNVLLDELNAYVGDTWFQVNFKESELNEKSSNYHAYNIFQVDGVANFMVYLEYYLKSARINHPHTYEEVNKKLTVEYIQYIWSKAEEVLIASYPYIVTDSGTKSIFFSSLEGTASALEHLKIAYSSDALLELDKLGISHLQYDTWNSTFFSESNTRLRSEKIVKTGRRIMKPYIRGERR